LFANDVCSFLLQIWWLSDNGLSSTTILSCDHCSADDSIYTQFTSVAKKSCCHKNGCENKWFF